MTPNMSNFPSLKYSFSDYIVTKVALECLESSLKRNNDKEHNELKHRTKKKNKVSSPFQSLLKSYSKFDMENNIQNKI